MEERNIRKLSRMGRNSLGVILPIEEIRQLGWREKQKIKVERVRGGFMLRDARK